MAVKIVGISPLALHRCTCRHCASELEYSLADTKKETHSDYGGGSDTVNVLTCPSCGNRIIVKGY